MNFVKLVKVVKYPLILAIVWSLSFYPIVTSLFGSLANYFVLYYCVYVSFYLVFLVLVAWAGYLVFKKFKNGLIESGVGGALTYALAYIVSVSLAFLVLLIGTLSHLGGNEWNKSTYYMATMFFATPYFATIAAIAGFVLGVIGGLIAKKKIGKKIFDKKIKPFITLFFKIPSHL